MRTSLIAGAVAIALAGFAVFAQRHHVTPPPSQIVAAESYWEGRIAAVGGTQAYREFSQSVRDMSASDQHGLAHAFGGALYHAVGISGITVCDAQFSYGCYHQFIGDAVASQGLGAVHTISDLCRASGSAGCMHGIGHGVVGFLGYTPEDLKRAVAECSSIDTNKSMQGCFGGAFMEYSMRTLASSTPRAATADKYAPCDQYTGAAAESCYLYQPQWWWVEHFGWSTSTLAESFTTMGQRCAAIADAASRDSCYEGIGEMAPPNASYASAPTLALCDLYQGAARMHCIVGAAVVFQGTAHDTEAMAVCAALPASEIDTCSAYAEGRFAL